MGTVMQILQDPIEKLLKFEVLKYKGLVVNLVLVSGKLI